MHAPVDRTDVRRHYLQALDCEAGAVAGDGVHEGEEEGPA